MTKPLTSKQIAELKALIEPLGFKLTKSRAPSSPRIVGEGTPGKRPTWWHGTNCRALDRLTQEARARGDWILNLPPLAVQLNRAFSHPEPIREFISRFGRYNPDRKALTYRRD